MSRFSILPAFAVLLLSMNSCLTMNPNHGTALGAGKVSVGAEASYFRSTASPDAGYDSYRVDAAFGVWDSFNLGLNAGRYAAGGALYYSAGGRALWAVPNESGSLAFSLDLDYYFGFTSGNDDADDLLSPDKYSLVQPSVSVAYAFTNGDIRPFVGLKVTPLLLTGYAGFDLQFGPLKPSLLGGASLPTIALGSYGGALLYTLEPALALEF